VIPNHDVRGSQDGPVLLLGGSLGTNLEMWEGQLPLAERFLLVRLDHRGHGESDAPPGPYEIADLAQDVLELMDDLGVERASYCGLSIGGMIGMWLGANVPVRVDRLVLICTSAHMPPASMWQERAQTVLGANSTGPIAGPVVERWLTPPFAEEHPDVRAKLHSMLVRADPQGYAACCGAIERMDLRGDLPRITAPTLVISGAADLATPVEHQRLIAGSIPGARHEIVSPAAHVAAVEQPEAVNRLIEEHLS
jgi:3-oxoadipate enol-lactonase